MADPFRMDGKTALITGAGRGIGKAIAMAFARQGAELLLTSRNEEKLRLTAQELTAAKARCRYLPADLSCLEDVEKLIDWMNGMEGIDCYVNNAAFTDFSYPTKTDPETIAQLFHTNYRASVLLAQAAARHMMAKGVKGCMLFITSINAVSALPSQAFYSSTKAALESIMKSFSSELAPCGIRVNSIAPGAIMTDMNSHFTPEKIVELSAKIPIGRIGEPEDIGDAAVFLCSEAARYVTGTTLVADGGYLLRR